MQDATHPRVRFPRGLDGQAEFEMGLRGCCEAEVEMTDGKRYALVFMNPERVQQELRDNTILGEPWLASPGLVVVPEVTAEAVRTAVCGLWRRGYFARLRPGAAR